MTPHSVLIKARTLALALSIFLIPFTAFAYRPKEPEPHHRYSTNGKFILDFDPKTNVHKMFSKGEESSPLWQFQSKNLWPYKHDESDGCLFVANDGKSIAGLTWVQLKGEPEDHRIFDGLEFWNKEGVLANYGISKLPSWRIPLIDFPVLVLSLGLEQRNGRGDNCFRFDEQLHIKTFGMRSPTFSLTTGKVVGWNLNFDYMLIFAFVYAIPAWGFTRWFMRRLRNEQQLITQSFMVRNLGAILVVSNLILFLIGMIFDSFGGIFDHIGVHFCGISYSFSFVLIPITLFISVLELTHQPRRVDWFGLWLAVLSAIFMNFAFWTF